MLKKFLFSLVITLFWIILMGQLIKPVNSKQIVAFEFAGSVDAANELIQQWQAAGVIGNVYKSIYLDFIFLVLYSATISFGLIWAALITSREQIKKLCLLFAVLIWVAAFSDVVENVGLLQTLALPEIWSVTVSFYSACIKFMIIGASIVVFLAGLVGATRFALGK